MYVQASCGHAMSADRHLPVLSQYRRVSCCGHWGVVASPQTRQLAALTLALWSLLGPLRQTLMVARPLGDVQSSGWTNEIEVEQRYLREGVVDEANVLANVRVSVVDKDPDVRNWVQLWAPHHVVILSRCRVGSRADQICKLTATSATLPPHKSIATSQTRSMLLVLRTSNQRTC